MQVGEIAEQENIPRKFLEQILLELKRRGFVRSVRGAQGGYALLRAPGEITFTEVLRLIDGPVAPLPCLSKTAHRACDDCRSEKDCEIRQAFSEVAEATRAVLDRRTVEDMLASRRARSRKRVG